MTIKELYEKYGDVELTEEQVKQIKEYLGLKNEKWEPYIDETYYYAGNGKVGTHFFKNDSIDAYKFFTNNCFKTKEEAEFRLEQIKVYNELKNFADENNEEVDWNIECKYHIGLNYDNNSLNVFENFSFKYIGQIYFSSKELAQQAIAKVGADRIKKYLCGVD